MSIILTLALIPFALVGLVIAYYVFIYIVLPLGILAAIAGAIIGAFVYFSGPSPHARASKTPSVAPLSSQVAPKAAAKSRANSYHCNAATEDCD